MSEDVVLEMRRSPVAIYLGDGENRGVGSIIDVVVTGHDVNLRICFDLSVSGERKNGTN